MGRKLTYFDKMAALAFHSRYRKEYKRLFPNPAFELLDDVFDHGRAEEIAKFKKRWGLEFVLDPEDIERGIGKNINEDVGGAAFSEYHETIKVIPHKKAVHGDYLDFSKNLRDNRYLTLQLDITHDATKVLSGIKEYIEFYRHIIGFKLKGRSKRSKELDHWEIYKQRHEGKNLSRITKDRFGAVSYPTADDPNYKQVTRAYKKASEIIRQLKPLKE